MMGTLLETLMHIADTARQIDEMSLSLQLALVERETCDVRLHELRGLLRDIARLQREFETMVEPVA